MVFTLFCNNEFDQNINAPTIQDAIKYCEAIMPLVKFTVISEDWTTSVNKYDDKDWMILSDK